MFKNKLVVILFLSLLTSCASAEKSGNLAANSAPNRRATPAAADQTAGATSPNSPAAQQVSLNEVENAQNQSAVAARKIIRHADLQLEIDSPETAQQKITAIAESKNGFVVESTQSTSDSAAAVRDTVTMTVRVPAEKFAETLDEIRKTGSRVVGETVKGDDVTEEFIDVEARLKAQKALEAQFLEIMKQSRSVEEALKVQRELSAVRSEIERVEGRLKFLENQTAFSTVKIRMQTPAAISASSSGFFSQLRRSVGSGFEAALNFVLGFVTVAIAVVPFLLLVVLPVFLVLRSVWRRLKRRKTASEIAREEIKNV